MRRGLCQPLFPSVKDPLVSGVDEGEVVLRQRETNPPRPNQWDRRVESLRGALMLYFTKKQIKINGRWSGFPVGGSILYFPPIIFDYLSFSVELKIMVLWLGITSAGCIGFRRVVFSTPLIREHRKCWQEFTIYPNRKKCIIGKAISWIVYVRCCAGWIEVLYLLWTCTMKDKGGWKLFPTCLFCP